MTNNGYENALLLITKAIDKIKIGGDDVAKNDSQSYLVRISMNIEACSHMSVSAIQLSNEDSHPSKGDTIKYIYTNSQHKNPLCRVVPVDSAHESNTKEIFSYDKEKYREMILDAAETV